GASRLPWLSGAATWAYYAATQYILGIQPQYDGLKIDPCIPADWKEFNVERNFRGKTLHIKVENSDGKEKGVKEIIINGEKIHGNNIAIEKLKLNNEVLVIMG
ncbi:MAG: glycosyl transferase, partial [Bacteroidales bacterium]|nr:glycosyl transferase [Bacteroidales bacterium]